MPLRGPRQADPAPRSRAGARPPVGCGPGRPGRGAAANGEREGDRTATPTEAAAACWRCSLSLDLDDLRPIRVERVEDAVREALEALRRGDWLRLGGDGEAPVHATGGVDQRAANGLLMVKRPAGRPTHVSMRSGGLLEAFRQGRAARIA